MGGGRCGRVCWLRAARGLTGLWAAFNISVAIVAAQFPVAVPELPGDVATAAPAGSAPLTGCPDWRHPALPPAEAALRAVPHTHTNTLTHNGCRVDATHATPRLASLIQFSVWFSCVLFGFSIYSVFLWPFLVKRINVA